MKCVERALTHTSSKKHTSFTVYTNKLKFDALRPIPFNLSVSVHAPLPSRCYMLEKRHMASDETCPRPPQASGSVGKT